MSYVIVYDGVIVIVCVYYVYMLIDNAYVCILVECVVISILLLLSRRSQELK